MKRGRTFPGISEPSRACSRAGEPVLRGAAEKAVWQEERTEKAELVRGLGRVIKGFRLVFVYFAIMLGCGAGMYIAVERGGRLEDSKVTVAAPELTGHDDIGARATDREPVSRPRHPLARLLVQLVSCN
jgi:hypothetical protein